MIDIELLLHEELGRPGLVPAQLQSDWEDVLRRGEVGRRGRGARPLLLVAATLLALAISVPALALHGRISETVRQFVSDSDEPFNARQLIEGLPGVQTYRLTAVRPVISADTPEGEVRLYELTFSNGDRGSAIVGVEDHLLGGAVWGPSISCPRGWALRAGGSMTGRPGSPLYLSGRISSRVSSVDVVYLDGHADPAALGNGYFLAWVLPDDETAGTRGLAGQPVKLVARGANGREIGRLSVRGDGDIPPTPGQPAQAVPCG